MKLKTVVIGSGNLAFHLAPKLVLSNSIEFLGVYSRNRKTGNILSDHLKTNFYSEINSIPSETQLVLLWVSDDQIWELSELLSKQLNREATIVHSSGTKNLDCIHSSFESRGCIWPLQSFSKDDLNINLKNVPFFICGSSEKERKLLESLVESFGAKFYNVNFKQKLELHLAAVLANNFVNHLIGLSIEIIQKNGFESNVLRPILDKTVDKALLLGSIKAQTGPAIREDFNTMSSHIDILKDDESFKKLYLILSESIIKSKLK